MFNFIQQFHNLFGKVIHDHQFPPGRRMIAIFFQQNTLVDGLMQFFMWQLDRFHRLYLSVVAQTRSIIPLAKRAVMMGDKIIQGERI